MKTTISTLVTSFACMLAFPLFGHSQTSKSDFAGNDYNVALKKEKKITVGYRNNVSAAILRDFEDKFEDVNVVNWVISDDGTSGYFLIDGDSAIALYSKNSNYISTRWTYTPNKLEKRIARFVKRSTTGDYIPCLITQLKGEENDIYRLSLQNKSSWCILMILKDKDGVLTVIDRTVFRKA